MLKSIISKNYEYNENKWVVSLVNTGNHAVIIVEGIKKNGSTFQGEYDITANSYPEEQSFIQNLLGNTTGYITKIRCNPVEEKRLEPNTIPATFFRDYVNQQYHANSWYTSPEKALAMIVSIEADAETLETEINEAVRENREVVWPFKYQKAGSGRWAIWGGNGGESCVTWAENKLAIAGVGSGVSILDSKKALPELHATRCILQ